MTIDIGVLGAAIGVEWSPALSALTVVAVAPALFASDVRSRW